MCFSATASFAAAALTGAVGVAALGRTRRLRDVPLAVIPLIFAAQQAIEGALWLELRPGPGGPASLALAAAFAGIALVLWPAWVPLAVGLSERKKSARLLICALIPVGIILAGYSALLIVRHPYAPSIVNASICYINSAPYPTGGLLAYVICTCLPPLLSSDKFLRATGIAIVIGMAVSAAFFYEGFFSVWCFFAALSSVTIFASLQSRSAAGLTSGAALRA
jgi:hypothetical protein